MLNMAAASLRRSFMEVRGAAGMKSLSLWTFTGELTMMGGEAEGAWDASAGTEVTGTADLADWEVTVGAGNVNIASKLLSRGLNGTKQGRNKNTTLLQNRTLWKLNWTQKNNERIETSYRKK